MRQVVMQPANGPPVAMRTTEITPATADPRDLAYRALGHALREPEYGQGADQEVRLAIRGLCDTAHARGLYAEQLIVLLKTAWRDLPVARRAAREHELTALERVVTLCIGEYYAPQRRR